MATTIHAPCLSQGTEKPSEGWVSGAPCPAPTLASVDTDTLSRGNLEVGFRPQKATKGTRESPPKANTDKQQGPEPEPASGASGLDTVARLARPQDSSPAVAPGPAECRSCSPGWSSAFYEADCFGTDVHSYVKDLLRQKTGGSAELEAQNPVSMWAMLGGSRRCAPREGRLCPSG